MSLLEPPFALSAAANLGWKEDGCSNGWSVSIRPNQHTSRDLRAILMTMAMLVQENPSRKLACVLVNSRMTDTRLQKELQVFRNTVREELLSRIWVGKEASDESLEQFDHPIDTFWLRELIERSREWSSTPQTKGGAQYAVLSLLTLYWLRHEAPKSAEAICKASGVSYPTLVTVLKELEVDNALRYESSRKIELTRLPLDAWKRWAVARTQVRKSVRFVDFTGQARSPESMAERLASLHLPQVAIGGVLGAKHYFPRLDLTASPRLDLTVHGKNIDLGFVRKLDAGLERTQDSTLTPQLIIHYLTRPESYFEVSDDGRQWADPVECLADLFEAKLHAQAEEMLFELKRR